MRQRGIDVKKLKLLNMTARNQRRLTAREAANYVIVHPSGSEKTCTFRDVDTNEVVGTLPLDSWAELVTCWGYAKAKRLCLMQWQDKEAPYVDVNA